MRRVFFERERTLRFLWFLGGGGVGFVRNLYRNLTEYWEFKNNQPLGGGGEGGGGILYVNVGVRGLFFIIIRVGGGMEWNQGF